MRSTAGPSSRINRTSVGCAGLRRPVPNSSVSVESPTEPGANSYPGRLVSTVRVAVDTRVLATSAIRRWLTSDRAHTTVLAAASMTMSSASTRPSEILIAALWAMGDRRCGVLSCVGGWDELFVCCGAVGCGGWVGWFWWVGWSVFGGAACFGAVGDDPE